MTKLLQKELININCPHCNRETSDVWICQIDSVIGIRYADICSNCEKLLGISLQKEKLVMSAVRKANNLVNLHPEF